MEGEYKMVNNFFAMIGIGIFLLGMYLWVYDIGDIKFSILLYLIGAAIIMFEFIMNNPTKDEVK